MGLSTVVVQGGVSIGAMVIGTMGAAIGVGAALSTGGAIVTATNGAVLWRVKALREDSRIDEDTDEARAVHGEKPRSARPVALASKPLDPEQTPVGR